MKTPEEMRDELDRGPNVHPFPPRRAKRTAKAPRQLSTVWADEIEIALDDVGVIDGLLPRTGLAVAYGESGSGKTFGAVDWACHIAAGRPWRGLEVQAGPVVYIAAESPKSVERRLWAWKKHHQVEHLPVLVVQSAVDLLNGDAVAIVELVKAVKSEHGRVAMVVVDTLARAMTGNENAPDDMGKFVSACGAIREAGDTLVLVVHHSGKNTAAGARGHSSLRAATDVEIEVTNGDAGGCIAVTKSRDDAGGRSFGFKLDVIELGMNPKGRMVTTCVAIEAEAPVKTPKGPTLTPKQRTVLDCYDRALVDHGQASPGVAGMPRNSQVVPFARWCEVALRFLPGDAPDWRKREDFKRSVEALQGKGAVKHQDGYCWRPSQTSQSLDCDAMR